MTPTAYEISVPQDELNKLKQKLELTTFPDEIGAADRWSRGAPLADIKRLAQYWKDGFDWRKAEAKLNELPNHMTNVSIDGFGGIDLHFVHQKSDVSNAIPLLFCHGWPGSFMEVVKILPLLKGGNGSPAFHVVAPSLPNYGFSGAVKKPGFGLGQYAEACHKLMLQLGYDKYVTQGGDWGFYITRSIGILYPEHCLASHINMIRPDGPPKFMENPILALQHKFTPYTDYEKDGFKRTKWFAVEGYGYNKEQSTKPQTIGYALADSPVALLAWIYEKLHDWTDGYPWTDDEILTWISIYQFSTAGPAANVHIYYEAAHTPSDSKTTRDRIHGHVPNVKLGMSHFPKELGVYPKTWSRKMGPVVYESHNEFGGHFAAWERPEVIAGDLKNMFKRNGPCFGIIAGRNGYESRSARANL